MFIQFGGVRRLLAIALLFSLFSLSRGVLSQEGTDEEYSEFLRLYGSVIVPPCTPPDWDCDGRVDGGDYVKWSKAKYAKVFGAQPTSGSEFSRGGGMFLITEDTGGLVPQTVEWNWVDDGYNVIAPLELWGGKFEVNNDGAFVFTADDGGDVGIYLMGTDANNTHVVYYIDTSYRHNPENWGGYRIYP